MSLAALELLLVLKVSECPVGLSQDLPYCSPSSHVSGFVSEALGFEGE